MNIFASDNVGLIVLFVICGFVALRINRKQAMNPENKLHPPGAIFAKIYYSCLALIPVWITVAAGIINKDNMLVVPWILILLPLTCIDGAICFAFYKATCRSLGPFFVHVLGTILFVLIAATWWYIQKYRHN